MPPSCHRDVLRTSRRPLRHQPWPGERCRPAPAETGLTGPPVGRARVARQQPVQHRRTSTAINVLSIIILPNDAPSGRLAACDWSGSVIHAQLPDGVLQEMPEQIRAVLAEAREVEFATISARGVPVNNPLFHYY